MLFGLPDYSAVIILKLQSFFHKEISLRSSLLNPFTFKNAVDLLIAKKIVVEKLNPKLIPFFEKDITSLFNGSKNNSVVKYMVTPNN